MKIKLILITVILINLTGCYNYRELNEIALTTAIGIDKIDDEYKVTTQIVNTQKEGSNSSSNTSPKIIIYSSKGKTIQEAIRKIVLESPKRIYPRHLQIIVISDTLAKEGIKDILDIFFRDAEVRKQSYVLIAKNDTAEDILKTLTPLDNLVSSNIENSLTSDSEFLGVSELTTFEDLMESYLNNNKEISLPSITLYGDSKDSDKKENIEESEAETRIVLTEMTVFKEDKMLGYLNFEESIALSYIKGLIDNSIAKYKCNDNDYITIEIIDSKTKVSTVKNKLEINIKVNGDGNINEINCPIDLEDPNTISDIENEINKKIETSIKNTIENLRDKYNSDIFGFLELFYKNNNSFYKKINKDWYSENFKKLKLNIDVKIQLTEKGNILKVINNEK